MLDVEYNFDILKKIEKVKDKSVKEQVKKQIKKIIEDPEKGKPMKNARKGTRELYVGSFRISYAYSEDENKIVFLDWYHKDGQ